MMISFKERQMLVNKIGKEFPSIFDTGTVTSYQVNKVLGSCPAWFRENTVSRGVYGITQYSENMNIAEVENVVSIQTATKKVNNFMSDYIPDRDPNFVPFGIYSVLDSVIKAKSFFPVYVTGASGNGKSATIMEICAKRKIPVIRVNINTMTDEEQLIGTKTLKNGNIEIVEGPVLTAMRNNCLLLLEEIDFASPFILSLQGILEGKPYYFKLNNEVIYPSPEFNIIATGNTKGKGSENGRYIGTNILNEAFLERFAITLEQEYPTNVVEYKIVMNNMKYYNCVDEDFAKTLVKWAEAIRLTFAADGIDETISTRRIVHIIKTYSIFKNKKKSIEMCCNRFDINTKLSFLDLYDKISGEPEEVPVEPEIND